MNEQNKGCRDFSIVDTTLRDGEQAPGVVFSRKEKLGILVRLIKAGVPEIEVGFPRMTQQDEDDIRYLLSYGSLCRLICWCRGNIDDLKAARRCGAKNVHISFPLSPVLRGINGVSMKQVLRALSDVMEYAVDHFEYISVGAQDVARSPAEDLVVFAQASFRNGARRIRLADTVGTMTPSSVESMMKALKSGDAPGCYEFHAHNDMGLATANSLAAVLNGCTGISVTVNGLGERAGNAALEQVVMAAEVGQGLKTGVHTNYLWPLSKYVARASGVSTHVSSPIVGGNAFKHESGVHTNGQIENKVSFQPFECSLVGRSTPAFIIGRHSGLAGLRHVMKNLGIAKPEQVDRIFLQSVKEKAYLLKRQLTKGELIRLHERRMHQEA